MASGQLISIIGLSLDGTRKVITPCWVINRGIDKAARNDGAPFRIVTTFVYPSGGVSVSQQLSVDVAATTNMGPFDADNDIVEAQLKLKNAVDANATVIVVTQIWYGKKDTVGDPWQGSFIVP